MKHRTIMLLTTAALTLSLLAACGPKDSVGGSASQPGSSSSGSQTLPPDGSAPDLSAPDASAPGGSQSAPGLPDSSQPDASRPEQEPQSRLVLNKTDFSLFKAGDSYRLKAGGVPQDAKITWTSSDEGVAAVSSDGTVTYVAPGSATITASADGQSAVCKVYCKPEADAPASGSGSSSSAAQVDLAAFYTTLTTNYEFSGFLSQADGEVTATFFPGLGDVDTKQSLVYVNMMSMNNGEIALIEVADGKDVDTVKEILQTRIDGMVNGGAWYPEPTRIWTECSKVVSNGNYIMMVVNEDYAAIVDEFNALF